ncbi:MAG TPA: hypothetical protein VHE30_23575 [Polyangiaceae bacterium]|nr:hypothetical protein [Polyangiaceae bacterium]
MKTRTPFVVLLAVLAVGASACQGPSAKDRFFPTLPPPPSVNPAQGSPEEAYTLAFQSMADVLVTHCGTLDCHGNSVRNFRVYDVDGLRLPGNVTGVGGTTDEEYLKTYESLVLLQPEVLSKIYAQHGAHPERWIVITKGRGSEHHKGGSRMRAGDDADRCIISWLSGQVDQDACGRASVVEAPPEPDGGAP